MPKPKGGRGKAAPYTTKQVRVPEPIISQVDQLINLYQDYLENGGDALSPPEFMQNKPVDKFVEEEDKVVNRFKENSNKIISELKEALKLKANTGGAIKAKIKLVLELLE